MDPKTAILWIGVFVFAGTSAIALLYLARIIQGPYEKLLVGTVVAQIAAASLAVFSDGISGRKAEQVLPISRLSIIEQADVVTVFDGTTPIYLRSPNVSRANNYAELLIDQNSSFASAKKIKITKGTRETVTIGQQQYYFDFIESGQIDSNANEQQSQSRDYAVLSIHKGR